MESADRAATVAFDRGPAEWRPLMLTPVCRKGFPAAALPEVLAALDLPESERPAVERRTAEWLSDYGVGRPEEAAAPVDGIGPLWRAAADAGAGLPARMFVPG